MMISDLQYITQDNDTLSHAQQAQLMFENGVNWVQIRMKKASKEAILKEAKIAMQFAKELKGTLIINDHIDICQEVGAHGVHLGLKDISIKEAKALLGDKIVGGTANTIEDIEQHIKEGADYIGLGPFRYTTTKENLSPIIGLEGYNSLMSEMHKRKISIPVVAVGGITMEDISILKKTGLYGVAISTSLLNEKIKTMGCFRRP